jgi:diguanylate cyclase (GGDEF)-like protein
MTETERQGRAREDPRLAVAIVLLVAGVALPVAGLVADGEAGGMRRFAAVGLPVALAGALFALWGWFRDRARVETLTSELAGVQPELGRTRELDHLRQELEEARHQERRWAQKWQSAIAANHRDHGLLGGSDDPRELVLRISLSLLEAERGVLLSRRDEDGDGDLDAVCAIGFEHDAEHSALAQRFAREVIKQDETVRENALDDQGSGGADDEIENLVAIPIYMEDHFHGVVVAVNREGGFGEYDDQVLLSLGDHAGALLHNGRMRSELRSAYLATVNVLSDAITAKDRLLGDHSEQVADLVVSVAGRLGVEPACREELAFASLLHDVGKIGIAERILLKPGALTEEERAVVEEHPRIGCRLVEQVPALRNMVLPILHHHERFDGAGYPSGLRGSEIPLEARIICVADCFSAMISDRPYHSAMSTEEACAELERCAGTQFDPEVVREFVTELRSRDEAPHSEHALDRALSDPELALRRGDDRSPVLGHRAIEVLDSLTSLYTRRYFHEAVAAAAQRAALTNVPFSVLVFELSDLDELNRREGYAAGDRCIQEVAAGVARVAALAGGLGARIAGRRLALLAPGADEESAERLASAVREDMPETAASLRATCATWVHGGTGESVVERALLAGPVPGY